jgi:hypothetical protein
MGRVAGRVRRKLSQIAIIDATTINEIINQLPPSEVELTPEQISNIASLVDVSDKVDKETGKSLVADTEIEKIHASGSDNQDLSSYVLNNDSRLSDARTPTTHSHDYEPANANIQSHINSTHAPANAQVNADITKSEIEAKLIGEISSHSHSGGADPFLAKLVLGVDKPTAANTTPVTLGLTFNYEANSKYVIDIYAIVSPTAAGTGCGFLIDVSMAVTYVGTFTVHQLAATGTISGGSSIGDKGATAMGVSSGMVGTNQNFVYGGALLITGANAGTAEFFFRSETTAVTTCKANTIFRIMKI